MKEPYKEHPTAISNVELARELGRKNPPPDIMVTVNGYIFGMTDAERQALRNILAGIARSGEEIHLG